MSDLGRQSHAAWMAPTTPEARQASVLRRCGLEFLFAQNLKHHFYRQALIVCLLLCSQFVWSIFFTVNLSESAFNGAFGIWSPQEYRTGSAAVSERIKVKNVEREEGQFSVSDNAVCGYTGLKN
jgi:hypothetical protein